MNFFTALEINLRVINNNWWASNKMKTRIKERLTRQWIRQTDPNRETLSDPWDTTINDNIIQLCSKNTIQMLSADRTEMSMMRWMYRISRKERKKNAELFTFVRMLCKNIYWLLRLISTFLIPGWPLSRQCQIPWRFPDGSRHSSLALSMLSVTHIMPVLVLLSVVG